MYIINYFGIFKVKAEISFYFMFELHNQFVVNFYVHKSVFELDEMIHLRSFYDNPCIE